MAHFGGTVLRSIVAGLATVVVAIVLFWILEIANPPLPLKAAISNVLGLVVVGVLVSLITQAYIRHTTAEELLSLIGLEKTLRDAGLEGVTDSRRVDWDAFLESSDHLICILGEPDTWMAREWDIVKEAAQRRQMRVVAYLDKPELVAATDTTLTDAAEPVGPYTKLQSDWADLADSERLSLGSSLTVRLAGGLPRYSIFLAGQEAMIFLHHFAAAPNPPGALVLRLKQTSAGANPVDWLSKTTQEN